MKAYRKLFAPLVISTLLLTVLLAYASAVRAELTFSEMALNPDGSAYEINPGPGGTLWISDYGAEEIWAIHPSGQVYTIYHSTGAVSDARQAPDGTVWWAELTGDNLARLDPATLEMTTWEVPGATSLIGTAIDDLGRVWLSQYSAPKFFSFDPRTDELCTYMMSEENGGGSEYLLAQGGWIWLGDNDNHRITRLDPDADEFTYWQLGGTASADPYPLGLAAGTDGSVWWADDVLGTISRLQPESDQQDIYEPPSGTPTMLAFDGAALWFSEYEDGSFGRLDPGAAAAVVTHTLTTGTFTQTPDCAQATWLMSATLTTTTGTAEWGSSYYTQTHNENGWQIYRLPDTPYDAFPFGIAASGSDVWLVDSWRQMLSRIQSEVSLTACKLEDADGDPGTIDDQVPVEGWTINLEVEGVAISNQSTSADGCTTWEGLEAGKNYEVWEVMQDGWDALTPTSYTDTLVMNVEHTFINHQPDVQGDMHIYLPAILR